jgi:hypothetical protein
MIAALYLLALSLVILLLPSISVGHLGGLCGGHELRRGGLPRPHDLNDGRRAAGASQDARGALKGRHHSGLVASVQVRGQVRRQGKGGCCKGMYDGSSACESLPSVPTPLLESLKTRFSLCPPACLCPSQWRPGSQDHPVEPLFSKAPRASDGAHQQRDAGGGE